MTMCHIADVFAYVRYKKSVTMKQIAKDLKVTPATLYYWERHNEIPLCHMLKIEAYTDGKFNISNLNVIDRRGAVVSKQTINAIK